MAMHRRISLSDIVGPEAIENRPPPPLPPKYFEYRAGGRDEFFRDLDAYQAAAEIHANHHRNGTVANETHADAPSYDSIGEAMPTIHETKIFKKRLLDTLRGVREFIERRKKKPTWSNFFGLSAKVQVAVSIALVLMSIGGIVALAIAFQQVAGLLALGIIFFVFSGCTYFIIRKYILKRNLMEALQIGLAKVERFEKIDDKSLKRIKHGIGATLNPMFWIENERRMEEAIPEELRMPAAGETPTEPAPPLTPPTDATTVTSEVEPIRPLPAAHIGRSPAPITSTSETTTTTAPVTQSVEPPPAFTTEHTATTEDTTATTTTTTSPPAPPSENQRS